MKLKVIGALLGVISLLASLVVLGSTFAVPSSFCHSTPNEFTLLNNTLIAPYEHNRLTAIRDRMTLNITSPDFTGIRGGQWFEVRYTSSVDAYQKDIDYFVMQEGQDLQGVIIAHVAIYNAPNDLDTFIVEIARFTWHSLVLTYNGQVLCEFPQVTSDGLTDGYATFRVAY